MKRQIIFEEGAFQLYIDDRWIDSYHKVIFDDGRALDVTYGRLHNQEDEINQSLIFEIKRALSLQLKKNLSKWLEGKFYLE